MKNRNIILATILLALGFLALSPQTRATCGVPDAGCVDRGGLAEGKDALSSLTTGFYNTGLGFHALLSNTTGNFNTAIGAGALLSNDFAVRNTATGTGALGAAHGGAFGGGSSNTANGAFALWSSTTGFFNTAVGDAALFANTTGSVNTAVGASALDSNIAGVQNTAVGFNALGKNTSGDANVAIGVAAGLEATTGDGNVYIGAGMNGVAGEANHTYIRNIDTDTVLGAQVSVDLATGRIGHAASSRRYKEDIKPMDKASEVLFALKSVSYRYKKEIDRTHALSFGLIAEEVAEISPDLITRDKAGKPESVRYEAVNAMLLNEFLKEHKKVEEQQTSITELKSRVAQQQKGMEVLTAQLKEQAAQIQKVSAQLELNKPVPQTVANK